jgi:hypothetical protein
MDWKQRRRAASVHRPIQIALNVFVLPLRERFSDFAASVESPYVIEMARMLSFMFIVFLYLFHV